MIQRMNAGIATRLDEAADILEAQQANIRMERAEMDATRVDLTQLVNEIRQGARSDYEGRNVTWTVGDLPSVWGDATMLRQVFVNKVKIIAVSGLSGNG